jgi:hypothetical protein
MGLRRWFWNAVSVGDDSADPDEFVELVIVPLAQGPMLVNALGDQRIRAISTDSVGHGTGLARARIMVARKDLDRADRLVKELLASR